MGYYPFLAEPNTEKTVRSGANWALASMQGWRKDMEDAHVVTDIKEYSMFAIFDGHGGRVSADYCAENLPAIIQSHLEKKRPEDALYDGFLE